MKSYSCYYNSPIGLLLIVELNSKLFGIDLVDEKVFDEDESSFLTEVKKQLDEYFKGERKEFDLELEFLGTAYMKKVWKELVKIPYGETISYSELARRVGNIKGARSAGMACGANNILIVVPCHRVVGKDGSLTGFGAGLSNKEFLLELEKKNNG